MQPKLPVWTVFLIAFVVIAAYVRLYFAVDITDEAQYMAQAYAYLLDGELFESDLLIQGTPGVLIQPILWIYNHFFGTEAIGLLLRHFYFFLAVLTAWLTYRFLRKHYPPEWAVLAASLYIAFQPFSVPSWSYNNVAFVTFPLSLLLLFENRRGLALWAGLLGGVACFSYAPLGATYIALLVMLFRGTLSRGIDERVKWTFIAAYSASGMLAVFMVFKPGFERFHQVLEFSRTFGELGGPQKVLDILILYKDGVAKGLFYLFAIAGAVIYFRRDKIRWTPRYDLIVVLLGLVASLFARIYVQMSLSWMIYATSFLYVAYRLKRISRVNPTEEPFWLNSAVNLSLVSGVIFAYTSGNILINGALGLMLALQFLLLEAGLRLTPAAWPRARWSALLAVIVLFFSYSNYGFVYRDGEITELTEQVESGPFKYLFTTPGKPAALIEAQADLKKFSNNQRTLFVSYMTAAYLFTDLKPLTGMLYVHEYTWAEAPAKMILHHTFLRDQWPEVIFTKKSADPKFIYQFEDFFKESGKYDLVADRSWYRIMRKKNSL